MVPTAGAIPKPPGPPSSVPNTSVPVIPPSNGGIPKPPSPPKMPQAPQQVGAIPSPPKMPQAPVAAVPTQAPGVPSPAVVPSPASNAAPVVPQSVTSDTATFLTSIKAPELIAEPKTRKPREPRTETPASAGVGATKGFTLLLNCRYVKRPQLCGLIDAREVMEGIGTNHDLAAKLAEMESQLNGAILFFNSTEDSKFCPEPFVAAATVVIRGM